MDIKKTALKVVSIFGYTVLGLIMFFIILSGIIFLVYVVNILASTNMFTNSTFDLAMWVIVILVLLVFSYYTGKEAWKIIKQIFRHFPFRIKELDHG